MTMSTKYLIVIVGPTGSGKSDLAIEIAGKVVGKELKEDDQSALVDQFIDGLGDEV